MSDKQNHQDVPAEPVTQAAEQAEVTQPAETTEQSEASEQAEVAAEQAELPSDALDPLAALDMIKQLAAAQEEISSLKDQMLRTVADAQNTKRRAEQDVTKAHKFGTEKFAAEMLPIVDSLTMALQNPANDEATKALHDGVEMTLNMFIKALEKFSVMQVDPQGEAFDPALHQAMSMVDGGEAASNTVVAVMQKGFTLNGRLLRPAMVMVAK
ncbi:MAG: hsp 24 DnaK nucleotide exchange factor [Osedax symbiont Rs2]|nr:MAG: hsp 24 DnaK nucleotide exchange factor [Osedax symbiont Rs2]